MTDITEIPAKDGKLYVSAIFDCYDLLPAGLAMADHMRAELCCETLKHANLRFPKIRGAIVHSAVAASTPVLHIIGQSFKNTALCKA